jgi:hypothetical protein
MAEQDRDLPSFAEMCHPFLYILNSHGRDQHAAYLKDIYRPMADYFKDCHPRVAEYHQCSEDHAHHPGAVHWEEHVRCAHRQFVEEGLTADIEQERIADRDQAHHKAVQLTRRGREEIERIHSLSIVNIFAPRFSREIQLTPVRTLARSNRLSNERSIRHPLRYSWESSNGPSLRPSRRRKWERQHEHEREP